MLVRGGNYVAGAVRTVYRHIESVGAVQGEKTEVGVLAAEKVREPHTGIVYKAGGAERGGIAAATGVRANVFQNILNGVYDNEKLI